MSMNKIVSTVYLDVYDHDTSPSTIKTISLDSQTRFVQAYLQKMVRIQITKGINNLLT